MKIRMECIYLNIYQTPKQIDAANYPTILDFEEVLTVRQPYYNDKYLQNLRAGEAGEQDVIQFLIDFGQPDWTIIRNIWANFFGRFECDLIVMTRLGLLVFEVKNYNGDFLYENNDCIKDGILLPDNVFTQAKRNFRKIKGLARKSNPNLKVEGAIIFIGEHNTVTINSPVTDIKVLRRNEFKKYILNLVEIEKNHFHEIDYGPFIQNLKKYEVINTIIPDPVSEENSNKLRKGIYCVKCHSFNVTIKKFSIHCSCGVIENRERGTVRTICEYGVLNFDKEIILQELQNFLNYQSSDNYLRRILKKHFTMHHKNRYTTYDIPRVPIHKTQYGIKN